MNRFKDLYEYTHNDVELISKDEIEEIAMKYLKNYLEKEGVFKW